MVKKEETLQERRLRRQKEAERQMRKFRLRRNGFRPILATVLVTLFMGYFIYTEATLQDGFESQEVYVLQNVAMDVVTGKGYEAKILTPNPTLTIYGDEGKVASMKKQGVIPQIELDVKRKGVGTYKVTPKVVDTLINVHYRFNPSQIEVQVIQADKHDYDVLERYYAKEIEGFYIEKMVAQEKATLLLTDEETLTIGYVVADLDASLVTESGLYEVPIIVTNKKGKVIDVPLVTETVQVQVTLSPLSWYQRQQDRNALIQEIATLEQELNERRTKLPTVADLLQRADLEKEIEFREQRLPMKQQELAEKETGLADLKAREESEKKEKEQLSLLESGSFVELNQ